MENLFDKKLAYSNILNRISKKYLSYEGLILLKKLYFTDNIFYYYICILIRFIHLMILSGNFSEKLIDDNNIKSFQHYLKVLSCYKLIESLNISIQDYFTINLIVFALYIFKIILDLHAIKKTINYKYNKKSPLPYKFKIIIDHLLFLFFPYIIEYLSFSYYIYFFPNKFIIKNNGKNNIYLFIVIILNTIFIIIFNIENYLDLICCNKIYSCILFTSSSSISETRIIKNNSNIAYKNSNYEIFIFIFLQNFILYLPIENYLKKDYFFIFKIVVSIFLFIAILILLFSKINTFNYSNSVNTFVNILILICFYSVIFDFIIYISGYRIKTILNEIIYVLLKVFISYTSFFLIKFRRNVKFTNEIINILFKEKNIKNNESYNNCFYYLHQILIKIKEKNDIESTLLLIEIINKHMTKCSKIICNCKLFSDLIAKENIEKKNNEQLKEYISELLIKMNFLFESIFIDINFYKNIDLTVLLAEHYCHLKDNPTMSFSIINTLLLKRSHKFSKIQLITLYELCQRYISYLSSIIMNEDNKNIQLNNIDIKEKKMQFIKYYNNLKMSYKIKQIICNYIDIMIKLLKYKSIFEDSLTFKYDENNENIISVNIKFFEQKNIDNLDEEPKNNQKKANTNSSSHKNNLYLIIYLLKKNQFYYQNLIDSIFKLDIKKGIPIFVIFKYFLFFDIFENRKIPEKIANKLYGFLSYSKVNNKSITKKEISILKKRYYDENNKKGSENYIMFEFKRDLRIKYFEENAALKLGFKQIDLINEKIDVLMPKSFCSSHQNAINHLIIGNQVRYKIANKAFLFDKNSSTLYPSRFEFSLIYDISKNLILMSKYFFITENQYKFMFNNNFELIANSRNFEKEYYLNQKLILSHNINILEILNLKKEKMYEIFRKELKKVQKGKIIRQLRSEEYLIPQFYTQNGETIKGMMDPNYFNKTKNKILSNFNNNSNDSYSIDDQEENTLIPKNNFNESLNDFLSNSEDIIFNRTYNMALNKKKFIENLYKELIKIPDNDLMVDNESDKNKENLIISLKKSVSKLLIKNELINNFMLISIKFSFFYDKPFYFITIDDQKKFSLNILKTISFEKNNNKLIYKPDLYIKKKNKIPFNNKENKKSRNKLVSYEENLNLLKNSQTNLNKINFEENKEKYENLLDKVYGYRKKINRDKFIFIIEIILTILIIFILIMDIFIIIYQKKLIKEQEKILITYYLSNNIKIIIQNIHSQLLQIFLNYYGFVDNKIVSPEHYQNEIQSLLLNLKNNYHEFSKYFINYNLDINHDFDSLYKKLELTKLKRYWEEIKYESNFVSEIDFIIYDISIIDIINKNSIQMKKDIENFPFFRERSDTKEKPNTTYIKVLHYLCSNYEFVFKDMFLEIENEIYSSFKNYAEINTKFYRILEEFGILIYIIFYITILFYLYFSNMIIIKNVIFLFLDFDEKDYDKNKTNNVLISLKLFEFQCLIDDFDLNNFEKYSINLETLNKRKYKEFINDDIKSIFKININNNSNSKGNQFQKSVTSTVGNLSNSRPPILRKNNLEKVVNKKDNKNNFALMVPSHNNKRNNMNNSSYNYLVESCSHYFKDKLNIYYGNSNKENLFNNNNISINSTNQNIISSSNSLSSKNINNKDYNLKEKEKLDIDNYQDILLNKSNKSIILLIKIFCFIIIILIIIIIAFNIYKFCSSLDNNSRLYIYFDDFTIFSSKYSMLFYYFNILRTLFFFPDGKRKILLEESMEFMSNFSNIMEEKFNNILALNLDKYNEVKNIFNLVTDSRNNITSYLKQKICEENVGCQTYLDSEFNIFDSGIDFALRTCMIQLSNIFRDYKELNNKHNISEINITLINNPNFKFIKIGNSINNMFLYIEKKIFNCFLNDSKNFNKSYYQTINTYNIISIIFSVLLFLFVIVYIFISISKFTEPIRNSAYRINLSFFYVKKYRLIYEK